MVLIRETKKTDDGATIETAYRELSQEAFAIWIRMMVLDEEDFIGRQTIAKKFEMSEGRSNVLLRELKNKGYIAFEPGPRLGTPTRILIRRRLLLAGRDHILKLSDARFDPHPSHPIFPIFNSNFPDIQDCDSPLEKISPGDQEALRPDGAHCAFSENLENLKSADTFHPAPKSGKNPAENLKNSPRKFSRNKLPKQKVLTLDDDVSGRGLAPTAENSSRAESIPMINDLEERKTKISLEKIQKLKLKNELDSKSRRDPETGKFRTNSKTRKIHLSGKALADYLATSPADQSFDPGEKALRRLASILNRSDKDLKRRKVEERLGKSFREIYGMYRRLTQRTYQCFGEKEHRASVQAARLCILKDVRPSKLIAYWDLHVGDFTDMKFPALTFLASPAIVDRAACARIAPATAQGGGRGNSGKVETHAYDTNKLDTRLRPGLQQAGFDLSEMNDRYLMTIQSTARTIARGFPLFVSSQLKPMVDWAVTNLFQEG